jgi:hypothetical protein
MKVFIIGLPDSGRTTVAQAVCQEGAYQYANASSWLSCLFRERKSGEHIQQYQEEYHQYLSNRIKLDPDICINNVVDSIKCNSKPDSNFVIDGVMSPRDFTYLFDINKDIVIFLNRLDNLEEYKDSDGIAVSVIRDYCFWLASAGFLSKERWIEYNFKIPGEDSSFAKELGSKNKVFLVKSINKVISHLKEMLSINLLNHQS